MKIRKSTTYVLGESEHDVHTPIGVSKTIPDQTMPLKELLNRYARGLEVPQYTPSYSDEEIPDLARLDLSEIQELKEINSQRIANMRSEIQASVTKRQTATQSKPLENNTDFDSEKST